MRILARNPYALATLAGLGLACAGVRHRFFWGEGYAGLLNVGEAVAVAGFAALCLLAIFSSRLSNGIRSRRSRSSSPGLAQWTSTSDPIRLVSPEPTRANIRGSAEAPPVAQAPSSADRKTTWRVGILLTIFCFAAPPMLTTDLFDYVLRGRVEVVHGANPYLHAPAEFPDDPLLKHCNWRAFVMPYGPISAALQAAIAWLAGGSIWAGIWLWKLAMGACHVATARLLERTRPDDPIWARLWLWNPFLLLELPNSAHNEGLMALFLALMVERLVAGRMALATLAFGCAVLTKHGCVVIGPLLLVLAWRQRRLGGFALGVLGSGVLTALFAWRYFLEPHALDFLGKQLGNRGASLQAFVVSQVGAERADLVVKVGNALTCAFLAWACCKVRDLESFAREASAVVIVFLLVAMPLFFPWYHLWWLPLAALLLHGGALALVALSVLGPLSYLVFLTTRSYATGHQALQWALGLAVPAIVVFGIRREAERQASRTKQA